MTKEANTSFTPGLPGHNPPYLPEIIRDVQGRFAGVI